MIDRKMIEDAIDSALDKVLNEKNLDENVVVDSIEDSAEKLDQDKEIVEETRADEVESTKVLKEQDKFEEKIDDDPVSTEEKVEEAIEAPAEEVSTENVETPSVDMSVENVEEKIEDVIEEEVEKNDNFNFLGLDIRIETVEDGFNVTISKDGTDTVEHLDSLELPNLLGIIETFFNNLILKEDNLIEEEVTEEDLKENTDNVTLASLRKLYASRIEEFFTHGIMAKEMALDMIKEKITAKNVGEMLKKLEEKKTILSDKKAEYDKNIKNYVISSKLNEQYKNAVNLTTQAIDKVHDGLTKGIMSKEVALKAVNKYKTILSNIINSNSLNTIVANVNSINKVNAIISSYIDKNENKNVIISSNNVTKNKIKKENKKEILSKKSFVGAKNILNSNGWNDNSTLLSNNRHDGIAEMSSEIMRIAGLLDEEDY
ncbi:MAG TPA: hypothetical protein PLM63_02840 [bacterium]|nr:hypothetical protein [bacterium]